MQAAKIAPPAGPDSTSRTGKRIAVSVVVIPPPPVYVIVPSPPSLVYVPTTRVDPAPEVTLPTGRWARHGNGVDYPYVWVWEGPARAR